MKLLDLITEQKNTYGCAMLYFDFPKINDIHNLIDNEHIYNDEEGYGLEKEPHVTLLYGLHDVVGDDLIRNVLNKFTFGNIKIHTPSLFNNEKYDVLKFDVDGDKLHDCNGHLKKYPHTSDYPDYHPHLTVGYLKKGFGQKYVDKLGSLNFDLQPKYAVYSKSTGEKVKIPIKFV